jgi:hypothetical protein
MVGETKQLTKQGRKPVKAKEAKKALLCTAVAAQVLLLPFQLLVHLNLRLAQAACDANQN